MKKRIAIILAIALVSVCALTVLAACDDPEGGGLADGIHSFVNGVCTDCGESIASTANYGSAAWDEDHTITIWTSQGQNLQAQMDIAIRAFETKYPGWTIDLHTISGDYDELFSEVSSKVQVDEQPDLAFCYPDHVATYMLSRKVVDLAKYIYSEDTIWVQESGYTTTEQDVNFPEEDIADIPANFWNEGLATSYADYARYGYNDDTIFTLPVAKSTELMYYNKTALKNAGIVNADGSAKVPQTWDELWEMGRILLEKYPSCTPLGYDSEANWFITMCQQNGWGYTSASGNTAADHFLFNNAGVRDWLRSIQGLYTNEHMLITRQTYGGQYTSNLFKLGTNGGAIFCIGSSAGASNQDPGTDFEWGVAPIPGSTYTDRGETKINNSVISQGPSMVMFRSTKATNPDEKEYMSFLFMKELLDPTFQASYSISSGYTPVRLSALEVPAYKDTLILGASDAGNIVQKAIYVASTISDRFFTSPVFSGSSKARTEVGALVVQVLNGAEVEAQVRAAIAACGVA